MDDSCVPTQPFGPDQREDGDPFGLVRCDVRPDLCELPVASDVRQPNLERAIDLVFVSDGFDAESLDDYRDQVDALVDGARADPLGILVRAPDRFNVHRVDVVSVADGRALGSCTEPSPVDGRRTLFSEEDPVRRAAANAPDVDVVIVITRGAGVANASQVLDVPRVALSDADSAAVFTHELGHALFGLGDEYVRVDRLHPDAEAAGPRRSDPRLAPNVSLDPAEGWAGVHEGTREGAAQYGRGVFRPTDTCRMRTSDRDAPFCPVCTHHIDTWLLEQSGEATEPPTCIVSVNADRTNARIEAWDANGVDSLSLFLDDAEPIDVFSRPCARCRASRVHRSDFTLNEAPNRLRLECVDTTGARAEAVLVLEP